LPQRKCSGCGAVRDSSLMIRILKVHDSQKVLINPDSRYFGRSSYLCYNKECIQIAIKKKRIQKTLKKEIPNEITEQILGLIKNFK
jgi:hypothetical protein